MDSLLYEHDELEKQELALSSPRYFNDPLEGYQDVFWKGDEVLWENLLRNYLLNLLGGTIKSLILQDEEFKDYAIEPTISPEKLPTDEYRELFNTISQAFFDEAGFRRIPPKLANLPNPLRRKGLESVLSVIHHPALQIVSTTLENNDLISRPIVDVETVDAKFVVEFVDSISEVMSEKPDIEIIESIGSVANTVESHIMLQQAVEKGFDDLPLHAKIQIFFQASFPGRYVQEIVTSLLHQDWHTLCFAKECTSPPMWAAYANDHRGAALMFRSEDNTDDYWGELTVTGRTGWKNDEPIYDDITAKLHDVDYSSTPPEVDFFRSLGTLSFPELRSAWHSTPDGRTSEIAGEIFADYDAWIDSHWDQFENMTTRKLSQWEHEQEVRMVLPDLLNSEGSHKKVNYDMSKLEGVIFGLRTDLKDRFEVIRILSEKSPDGDPPPVDFYEMTFNGKEFKKTKLII